MLHSISFFLFISNYCIEIVSRMPWFCYMYMENPLYIYLHINEVLL